MILKHIQRTPFNGLGVRLISSSSLNKNQTLSFFTKDSCMLCTNAKDILFETLKSESLKDKRIKLKIIDIMKSENQKWFDIYCYDVPVLHIETTGEETPIKFMHYFDKSKILEQLNK